MAYSTGGLELLVGLASEEIGGKDGPRITSACHCSSRVCEPGERRCNSRKMSPLLRSGLAISQDRICSHSPSKGSLWVRRQPRTRFLRSCSRYKVWSPATASGLLSSTESIPVIQHSMVMTRIGEEVKDESKGKHIQQRSKEAVDSGCVLNTPKQPGFPSLYLTYDRCFRSVNKPTKK